MFITGIAGNDEEGFIAKSKYFTNGNWQVITENEYDVTSLLSKNQIDRILETDSANIQDFEINENEFLQTAENINQILHDGAINKEYRARVISALLLALAEGSNIDLTVNPSILIESINSRVDLMLKKHKKQDFARYIKIDLPSSEDNHIKFKGAIIRTIQELLELNIRSAMKSGKDVLGKFYEIFLKYGNGAKEIGIVLTPRHLTRFSAEILEINENDMVFDPTCGTGGFLVAALDEVKKKCKDEQKISQFKKYGIYGIEEQDTIVALALVNMIFRGDGKNNIIEGNCFNKWLNQSDEKGVPIAEYLDANKDGRIAPITKVLMNPPFAQKGTQKKEYDYVERALNQMQDDGLLFAILPMSVLLKGGEELSWRKEYLLKNHTVLSIITFSEDLFYPVGVRTIGLFIKKGVPHNKKSKVFWAKVNQDGYVKSKGKRLESSKAINELLDIKELLIKSVKQIDFDANKPKSYINKSIDFSDKQLELIPEAYLDEGIASISETVDEIDKIVRELFSFLITSKQISNSFLKIIKSQKTNPFNLDIKYKIFSLNDLFSYVNTGNFHVSGELDKGNIPLISCKTIENGTEGYFDIDDHIFDDCITIAADESWPMSSFFHPYKFAAKDNVIICQPNKELNQKAILFITAQLNSQIWRFSYGRKCYLNKTDKIQIPLPVNDNGDIDFVVIDEIVDSCQVWNDLKSF
ncbi:MAG: Restriction enzyme BgcI subunit alpha [Candidatus Ordinivivax streblomastigis]|uniref:site-specific DNA-methyltransferase (adenine-specific) n=1 Tax=Candidatus Ordinivivax streblomastigis TaxID=2540710 RepID=A0A5M8P264_9BACT|nr:MAG: Restriction enzyme BgcI subunit alpha [Candidatus Ordinivivax streblomastigis]